MSLIIEEKDLQKFILIGDRVLIRPKTPGTKTKSGLYLPPTVQEKENLQFRIHFKNRSRLSDSCSWRC